MNHHLRAAKRVLNWAVESEYLHRNPWASKKVKLEAEKGRERIVTPEEFRALLRHCTDASFKHVLLALRLTGCRPGEARKLTWGMVRWDTHCWVIPPSLHKTDSTTKEKKPRIVLMPPVIERLLRRRQSAAAEGAMGNSPVFTTTGGQPWRKDTISQRFSRLRERAGIQTRDGEALVLCSHRHTRLTELAPDVSGAVLQEVAGHTNFATTPRYLHLANQQVYAVVLEADPRRQPSGK